MSKSPVAQQAEGSWKTFKGRLQEAWGDLTNDDLDRFEGRMEQLEGHIEKRTGESREAVRQRIQRISDETKYRV